MSSCFSEIEIAFNKYDQNDSHYNEYASIYADIKEQAYEQRNRIAKETKKQKRNKAFSLFLTGVGVFTFLSVIVFQPVQAIFSSLQETLTICAFGVIVLMYATRELIEGLKEQEKTRRNSMLKTAGKFLELLQIKVHSPTLKTTIENNDLIDDTEENNSNEEGIVGE